MTMSYKDIDIQSYSRKRLDITKSRQRVWSYQRMSQRMTCMHLILLAPEQARCSFPILVTVQQVRSIADLKCYSGLFSPSTSRATCQSTKSVV